MGPTDAAAAADVAEAEEAGQRPGAARFGGVGTALRSWGTLRWLLLIEVADLLVDVFTGFLALYLVDVAHLTPAFAALAIAVRLGAALAGDAIPADTGPPAPPSASAVSKCGSANAHAASISASA